MTNEAETIELLRQVWSDLAALTEDLTEEEWARQTECPGWDVRDNISHIAGTESALLGRPVPDHEPSELSHIKNAIGKQNESAVDYRRSWTPAQVREDFCEVTDERLAVLENYAPDDWSRDSWTPTGPGSILDFMQIRIFDSWVHEQDIRRAIDRPGDLTGPVAEHAMGRCRMAMPFVVGKKSNAPDGVSVVFDISGTTATSMAIRVVEARAREVDEAIDNPDVRISLDFETFAALVCGRWEPDKMIATGRVDLDGDAELARRIVENMNVMI